LDSDLEYCAGQVRAHDRDRWLTALFAPDGRRQALWALYAFNLEVARIRESVREPALGQIRLQWWHDTLAALRAGKAVDHPVARALGPVMARFALEGDLFGRLLTAREEDWSSQPPPDMAALAHYAEATSATLMSLAARVVAGDAPPAPQVIRDAGIASALIGLLRALPFRSALGRVDLPADWLAAEGLTATDIAEHRNQAATRRVIARVAAAAEGHLAAARQGPAAARAALPALFPATLAGLYLRRLKAVGFNPYHPRLNIAPPVRQLALLWNSWRGRF
jgi:NADH dehydrogenase [ubiquinone] 1 alpha subcomplex assembly factor 6